MKDAAARRHYERYLLPTLWFAGFLLLWQFGVRLGGIPTYVLPAPTDFLGAMYRGAHLIWPQAVTTTWLILVGFFLGAVPAVPIGFLVATVPLLERTLYPLLVFINVIPKIALIPVLVVWYGFGAEPKIILAAISVFFPVMVDSMTGFKAIDRRIFYISRSMGASPLQTLRYFRVPYALDYIFTGLKIAIVLAVTVVVVTEFVGSNEGLGYLILRGSINSDIAMMFASLVVASLIGVALFYIVEFAEARLMPWKAGTAAH
jgi:NitT/TauT family transport system permease protein